MEKARVQTSKRAQQLEKENAALRAQLLASSRQSSGISESGAGTSSKSGTSTLSASILSNTSAQLHATLQVPESATDADAINIQGEGTQAKDGKEMLNLLEGWVTNLNAHKDEITQLRQKTKGKKKRKKKKKGKATATKRDFTLDDDFLDEELDAKFRSEVNERLKNMFVL